MDRPYVVCHMLASVDGKIDGAYMRPRNAGTVTMEESCSAGLAPAELGIPNI